LRRTNEFGDFDAETVFDDDDFTASDELVIHAEFDGGVGEFVELDDGTDVEIEHVAHRQMAGAKLNGQTDWDIQQEIEVGRVIGLHVSS
jgi:hypothetical protein